MSRRGRGGGGGKDAAAVRHMVLTCVVATETMLQRVFVRFFSFLAVAFTLSLFLLFFPSHFPPQITARALDNHVRC